MNNTLKRMVYGHYILTALKEAKNLKTREEDYMAAGTVNWAMQVSFKPPMLAVAVGQKSDLNETIDYSEHFTLHLLGDAHKDMITTFGSGSKVEDGKINGVPFSKKNGELILDDSAGYITCKVVKSENVGDHTIHFGEVVRHETIGKGKTLGTDQVPLQYSEEKADT